MLDFTLAAGQGGPVNEAQEHGCVASEGTHLPGLSAIS